MKSLCHLSYCNVFPIRWGKCIQSQKKVLLLPFLKNCGPEKMSCKILFSQAQNGAEIICCRGSCGFLTHGEISSKSPTSNVS